ncbi:hypothetical protein JOJ86_004421 [Rhodococcus percolatus]|uniref:GvpL/GvpF family gas vesicle protein n=1 Tax=Rhodococcus opacus TaxID=37919 RepID=UPI0015FAADEC|nr:GvpL/GvpF family gas vesicle protein [Rhodococcus opacus]MBA8963205.1 hypothetical protein [Rhodococcus opacus]MBP2206695.1 hypothetical protein [Rhodococcus opacus]
MTASDGVWLYGITSESIDDAQLAGVTGVAGEPVRTVSSAGLAAVVGSVSLSEFGEGPLRLATLYLDDDRIRALLDERQQVTDPAITGKRQWMIFNGTYLVADVARADRAGRPDR